MEKRCVYVDIAQFAGVGAVGVIGLYAPGVELDLAGTAVHAMPVSYRDSLYRKWEREQGVYFIFEDHIPEVPFFAVPAVELAAEDSEGGYLCSLAGGLRQGDVCYISRELACFWAASGWEEFAGHMDDWRERLRPFDGVRVYPSKEVAGRAVALWDMGKFGEDGKEGADGGI